MLQSVRSLLRLKPYLRPQLRLIVGSALLAVPLSAMRTGPAPLVKYMVDDLLVKQDARKLLLFPAVILGIFALNFVIRFFHYYLLKVVVARVSQRMKNDLFRHLLGLSADYYTAQSTGTLISRVASDPQHVDGGLASLNVLIREPITFLFLLGYAAWLNWKLTLITLAIIPPLAWVFSATARNLKRYIGRLQEENARLFSTLQESFTGIRVIKTFQLEGYVSGKFLERSERFTEQVLKTCRLEEAAHPMVELLTAIALAAMIAYGGAQVLGGTMTAGDLLAFFAAFALMMNPLRLLNDANMKLNTAAAACDRIFEVFDWKPRLHEPADPRPLDGLRESLRFDDVRFAYPDAPAREVLRGVSFDLPRGRALALVGASGAGKSSLVNLIPRIFDVTGGAILIDGRDIRELRLDDLRSQVAVVTQDVFLFNDTVEENIRCGRLDATPEEVREAARRANALEFIERMPEGFGAVIGDRGQKLSGGERQRLSIARAFLRQAPILILDEATSSLDSASERAVQAALDELMRDRTTLIIAHRLSTVRHAHAILVLKEGRVIERGTHDELLRLEGEYARFHRIGSMEGPHG